MPNTPLASLKPPQPHAVNTAAMLRLDGSTLHEQTAALSQISKILSWTTSSMKHAGSVLTTCFLTLANVF